MSSTPDPFLGTWKLNPEKSRFDPNHRPSEARMSWEIDTEGHYVMTAEGMNAKGEKVVERPQRFILDGRPHPVPDFPGLAAVATRPDARTIRCEVRREDGSIVGEGTFVLSADGTALTATNAGYDAQLRQFQQSTVWDRG